VTVFEDKELADKAVAAVEKQIHEVEDHHHSVKNETTVMEHKV
jgi:hypothetical protein